MQKRTLYSLLLISFIVAFAASVSFANTVTIESKSNILRCDNQASNVDIEVTSPDGVDAIEFVFEIVEGPEGGFLTVTDVVWDVDLLNLMDRIVDLSQVDGVSPDYIRFAAMKLQPTDAPLPAGSYTVAQIKFTTNDNCGDDVAIDNTVFPYVIGGITTQFVDAATNLQVAVSVTPATIEIVNQLPEIADIDDVTLEWGDFYSGLATATDPDGDNSCEELKYYKVSGPDDLVVGETSGVITWLTTGADVCEHVVQVKVVDACGAEDVTSFTICVHNFAPIITCPDDQMIFFGEALQTQVTATDDEDPHGPGPYPLIYKLVSFDGPGMVMVDPGNGEIVWQTETTANYTGVFNICVEVTDSANVCVDCSPKNADTCCFQVEVVSMAIAIEKQHGDGMGVPQGQETTVEVTMLPMNFNNYPIGGFNFLIQYDATALSFLYAEEGEFLLDCEWEYFTYRFGPDGNCGDGCPSGLLRVVAIAETNNGAIHPECFVNDGSVTDADQLVILHFMVSNDRLLECQFVPIKFFWIECGDNTLSSVSGDTLLISRDVYDYIGSGGIDTWYQIDSLDYELPGIWGANYTCDVSDKGYPIRWADFWNGGVDIICSKDIDAPGDVNANGWAFEIADAVMFSNYFVDGLGAFLGHVDASIAATDVNKDGITLSIADLVYLIRVVVGDAQPYPKEVIPENVRYTHDAGVVTTQGDVVIGAAYLVVSGNVSPELLADNMEMAYRFDGQNTRIIVTPRVDNVVTEGFTGEFLGGIDGDILTIEMATVAALPIVATNVPTHYGLSQNYPNPFNPTTKIDLATPEAGSYSVTIYNIQGQVVDVISGVADAPGDYIVEWDASNNASGVYLYKLEINAFTSVKKMVLLK